MTLTPLHHSITAERVMGAAWRRQLKLAKPGFCVECGLEQFGCNPDTRRAKCRRCGKFMVYGAEELLTHRFV